MALSEAHIKKREPILNRLQSKTTQDEADAEYLESALRRVTRVVSNIGIDCRLNPGKRPSPTPDPDRKRPPLPFG